jgi:processive 1,2-diacylglycerol beta-glucosyltransferase
MRILILSASTGGGHMSAAYALESYVSKYQDRAVVKVVDTLEYVSPLLNKTVSDGYIYLAKSAPKVWSAIYKTANRKGTLFSVMTAITNLFSKKLMPLLDDFKPDAIVCTHHFPMEMISKLKDIGLVNIPLMCILTDYAPHKCWIGKTVDAYVVSNDNMVNMMVNMGVEREKIYPFGIPVNKSFHTKPDREKLLEDIGLNHEMPTILIMAGSFGVTDILAIYRNLTKINLDFQIIIITGKNKRLYKAFERLISKKDRIRKLKINKLASFSRIYGNMRYVKRPVYHKPTKLIFFTKDVYKYMKVSNLIITKPGGLTVSEALACDLPMAIFNSFGGQEEENADFLVKNNMAIRLGKGHHCEQTIKSLLINEDSLTSMKKSCESFDKSSSAKEIFSLLENLISGNTKSHNS